MNLRPSYFSWVAPLFRGIAWILGVGVFLALIIGLIWKGQAGCEGDRDHAKEILENAGYSKIEVGGAHGRRCGGDDGLSNEFTAIGPTGKYVEGVVCCARDVGCGSKACTIRF